MLFNSYEFLLGFLPALLVVLYVLAYTGRLRAAIWWAGLGSIAFYALGDWRVTPLLIGSIIVNYLIGDRIVASSGRARKAWLAFGVIADLAVLGYFKYANFFADNIAAATGMPLTLAQIALPIGISFYTFTQIAFLVDCGKGEGRHYKFSDYLLFVTFFPHLVAGPILNHKDVVPQFESKGFGKPDAPTLYAAAVFFSAGLFKKVIIADTLAPMVRPLFDNAENLTFIEAWAGALLYTFQLYFDFSGYSDMAVGLALLLNVRIPINFNSPYKSLSLVDFWRRWHISLSSFLRDYLYIPLGGNRKGPVRRYINLFVTMVLGGFWHGAGWTFLIWGALHGAGLAVNHAWDRLNIRMPAVLGWLITFLFVMVAWVFFRAETPGAAIAMLSAMVSLPSAASLPEFGARLLAPHPFLPNPTYALAICGGLLLWCVAAPNTQQVAQAPRARMSVAAALGFAFFFAFINLDKATDFLYFRF